jgi:hypothetical protein
MPCHLPPATPTAQQPIPLTRGIPISAHHPEKMKIQAPKGAWISTIVISRYSDWILQAVPAFRTFSWLFLQGFAQLRILYLIDENRFLFSVRDCFV